MAWGPDAFDNIDGVDLLGSVQDAGRDGAYEVIAGALAAAAGTGARGRRMLAEAEDHLRSAADDGVSRGLDPVAAQREAVDRFGPPPAPAPPRIVPLVLAGLGLAGLAYGLAAFLGRAVAYGFDAVVRAGDGFGVADLADVCASPIVQPTVTCTDPPSGTLLDNLVEPLANPYAAALALLLGVVLVLPLRRPHPRAATLVWYAASAVGAALLLITVIESLAGPWSHVARDGGAALAALAVAGVAQASRKLPRTDAAW
ncbi:permease prefix domain 1-containing protein [Dactylosporangium sp. CA-139066]|uniref:permease prefix domain 1-containing protein n=1 Tax=Dactylosporangium sp. CA-139066 TaxID=3239930 RepID=UPI003D8F3F56